MNMRVRNWRRGREGGVEGGRGEGQGEGGGGRREGQGEGGGGRRGRRVTHPIGEVKRLVSLEEETSSAVRREGGERRTRRARVGQLRGRRGELLLPELGLQLLKNEGGGMNSAAGRLAAGG